MLSIEPLKNAEDAADYYMPGEHPDNQAANGRWLGKGAALLGLAGKPVDKSQLLSLLSGILPNGKQLGRIDQEGLQHRPGFDMTLSAPKSFSILLETGADPRLAQILEQAAEWFVQEIEREFAETRQVTDGVVHYVKTDNLVIAAFRESYSRANDPQSHVHLVVQNMTQCPDGKWRSLASDIHGRRGVLEQLLKHHVYAGLKFRNYLGALTRGLGYELTASKEGFWEIASVPEQVLTHFSKQRAAIEELMAEQGWHGAKAAAIAAQKTRPAKEILNMNEWRNKIINECHALDFDPQQAVATQAEPALSRWQTIKETWLARFYGQDALQWRAAKQAVYVAIESVSQQQAAFELRALKKEALKHSILSLAFVDERLLVQAIDDNIKAEELYQATHPYTRQPHLTTPWQLTLEQEALTAIEAGKGAISAICSQSTVRQFIEQQQQALSFQLSTSQQQAMRHFLTTTDRYIAIQGYAGTGKTTMLRLTRELAAQHGYTIRGITTGSSAAHELRRKGGLNATTFARELSRLQQQRHNLKKTIFVIDEASMLSNPQGHRIIKLVEQFGSQLKIIGDKAQLPSPSSGKLFSLMQDYGIETAAMTDNLRQRPPRLQESALHASCGEVYDAVTKLTAVQTAPTYPERIQLLVDRWLALTQTERPHTLCFAPTHRNRHDITALLREALKAEQVLTGQEYNQPILRERHLTSIQLRHAAYYAQEEVIRFNLRLSRYRIQAGDYLTIDEVTKAHKQSNQLTLIRANGRKIKVKLAALPAFKPTNKDLERPIEVYEQHELRLMAGDTIQWKRNFEAQGIRNSERAVIKQITDETLELITECGRTILLNRSHQALQHVDHGYVLTTYAAQGKDKKRGLALIESSNLFAASLENFYVTSTRAVDEMILVTDNEEKLVKSITLNDRGQLSSLEIVNTTTFNQYLAQVNQANENSALQQVITKKCLQEDAWQRFEQTVTAYAHHKQAGKTALAAKTAFSLVNEARLYRLAQYRLNFSRAHYRRDALRFSAAKLWHTLAPAERLLFATVKRYVLLKQQRSLCLTQLKNNPTGNVVSIQQHLQQLTQQCHAIAATIGLNIDAYKPYLSHFSIGELNRLGLAQYDYGREEKKAEQRLVTLAKHAALYQLGMTLKSYLQATEPQKLAFAAQLKRQAKLAHPYVLAAAASHQLSSDALWQAITRDAWLHRDELFRNGLNPAARKIFDQMKTYKRLKQDLRCQWETALNNPDHPSAKRLSSQSMQLLNERNQLADKLLANGLLTDISRYFKLDLTKLSHEQQQHHYQQQVNQFVDSSSHFKARMAAAQEIKDDISGYYPLLKTANLSMPRLNAYVRVVSRQAHYLTLSDAEKKVHQQFTAYHVASRKVAHQWQLVYGIKAAGKRPDSALIDKALLQAAKRDELAYTIHDSIYLNSVLAYERGNQDKLINHSEQHQLKQREITGLNEIIEHLATQYQAFNADTPVNKQAAWQKNWATVNRQLNTLLHNKAYYRAREAVPLHQETVQVINATLKTQEELIPAIHDKPFTPKQYKAFDSLQKINQRLNAATINEALMMQPEVTYPAIWGEPKAKTSRELRYSGGLIVTLQGSHRGLWYDFCEGVGGAPIQAIMRYNQLNFPEALKMAAELAGLAANAHVSSPAPVMNQQALKQLNSNLKKNRIKSAASIWQGTVDIQGTLAERYLRQHRGVALTPYLAVRFWPVGARWLNCNEQGELTEKINKIPALVIAARNENNELTGVQRTYLDSQTANKSKFLDTAKLSKGIMEGSGAVIQKGMRGGQLYVAEGYETAASIAMADSKATVLVSFGIANMKNLIPVISKQSVKEVIIAADNDGEAASSTKAIHKTLDYFKQNNLNARIIFPQSLNGKAKTDWNDVLLKQGVAAIQQQLMDYSHTTSNLIPAQLADKISALSLNRTTQNKLQQGLEVLNKTKHPFTKELNNDEGKIGLSNEMNANGLKQKIDKEIDF